MSNFNSCFFLVYQGREERIRLVVKIANSDFFGFLIVSLSAASDSMGIMASLVFRWGKLGERMGDQTVALPDMIGTFPFAGPLRFQWSSCIHRN